MYHKVMFSSAQGTTAGLVLDAARDDVRDVGAVSRLYPYSEARKMRRYWVSPAYATWDEAFGHQFQIPAGGSNA